MKQKNTQQYIIFDINSASIGVLVFKRYFDMKKKKYQYQELFTTRELIKRKKHFSSDFFLKKTIDTLSSVADQTLGYVGNELFDIYINISAPWSSSQKHILHYENDENFIFTKEIESKILEKEKAELLHHTYDFRKVKELSIINQRVLKYFLNGYSTKKPYGKKVKDADIHSLISVMSQKTQESFQHIMEKTFHRKAKLFSNIFMLQEVIDGTIFNEKDFIAIDVSGETSEIFITLNHNLEKIGVIPVGSNHIIRELSQLLNIPFSKAKTLIEINDNNYLHDSYQKAIDEPMRKAFLSWFKYFFDFLSEISKEHLSPENVVLFAPEHIQNWIKKRMLKTEELNEHIHTDKNMSFIDVPLVWRKAKKKEFLHIHDDNLAMCLAYLENKLDS